MEIGKRVVWTAGGMYECTESVSLGYVVGEVYKCYENCYGHKCLMGRDGLEDLCSMLVSSFKRV